MLADGFKKIVVLVSGGGTNLQALIDAEQKGELGKGKIIHVISSKADVFALERADKASIPHSVISRKSYDDSPSFEKALYDKLEVLSPDLIVLAGFLSILGNDIVKKYDKKIINVHPSLIPSFCGKGFYGLKVHQSALDYGVKVTGATVHYVNEIPDGGEIIMQKAVDILDGDTAETLQLRVMVQAEQVILPKAVKLICC